MTRTNHYFYHYPCPDGAFAALAGHLYFSHAKEIAVFHPMKIYLTPEEQFDVVRALASCGFRLVDSQPV